jgi:5-hydroxyisourate hydrolase-like protein (transthyretin family)
VLRHLAIAAAVVAALPVAAASAATLHLQAPREVDRAEKFKVTAFGKAKPERTYRLSVLYHDNDQGRCAKTVEKEVTRREHAQIFYMRRVRTDARGRFERSRNIFGGDRETSGKFCGYLTNADGKNKDTVVRAIDFI